MARLNLSSSLLLACLLVLLSSPTPSAAVSQIGNPNAPRHIQHAQLVDSKKRMVKVRQILGGNRDKGDTTGDTGNDTGNNGSVSGSSTTTTSAAVTTTTAARTTTTQSQSIADSPSSAVVSTTTTTTTTTPPASTTSAAPTTTTSTPTLNLIPQSSSTVSSQAASQSVSVATAQVTVDLPTQSAEAENQTSSANTFGRNTIIAIVVIASCVGGAAAIWTLIRKWKLGPSAKFEERMAPIEWSPDMASTAGAGIPGAEREKAYGATEKHSRNGSHGSFHSSDVDHNNVGRNVTGNGNMFADQHPTGYAPDAHDFTAGPSHDFTAGPANYNTTGYDAYGNPAAGYADLQRTNSNGSNRSENGGLQRGPSVGNAAAAPYAYDNGYGGAQYGHDAYGQDAYASYDAYGQHYPAQQGQYGAQQGQYGARY